jgi:hypothetical protein
MGRREGEVSSTLHGRKTARGGLGRRSPWTNVTTAETADSDELQTRTAAWLRIAATAQSGRGEVRRFGQSVGMARRCRDAGVRY